MSKQYYAILNTNEQAEDFTQIQMYTAKEVKERAAYLVNTSNI